MDRIMTDIGSRLRQARELRGLTLRDIATTTKISMSALTAMERNDFARLPGGVFRRAYVKAFAREVGLNADELAGEYRAAFEGEPPADPAAPPHRHPGFRFAPRVPAVLAAVAALGIWGASMLHRRTGAETAVPPPQSVGVPGGVEVNAAPPLRLEIHTTAQCWVSAAADGDRAVYRLMQPGDRALVEARDGITLRVGNAGAVVYSINGATGRPLGELDEAVTVHITNDNVEELSADPGGHARPEIP